MWAKPCGRGRRLRVVLRDSFVATPERPPGPRTPVREPSGGDGPGVTPGGNPAMMRHGYKGSFEWPGRTVDYL